MRYFYDFEFYEDGTVIVPISLGIVSEDNRSLYLVNKDYMEKINDCDPYYMQYNINEWLLHNVINHITELDINTYGYDLKDNYKGPGWQSKVYNFISDNGKYKSRLENELWGYYSAYDHVALAQLWGPMINLPEPIPMFTHDLKTIQNGREINFYREKEHHALYDAYWNKRVWEEWNK